MISSAFSGFSPHLPRHARHRAQLRALGLMLALAVLPGCSVCQQARRTMLEEPAAFAWKWDRARSLKVYRQWALEAWSLESGSCGEPGSTDDYALGFRDGFVDTVYGGGEGEPPPVPPRKFWNVGWRTEQGDAAAREWFAGYRHGAHVAQSGGYRERGVVESSYRSSESWMWDFREPQYTLPPGDLQGAPQELLPEPAAPSTDDDALPAEPEAIEGPIDEPIDEPIAEPAVRSRPPASAVTFTTPSAKP